MCVGRRFPHAGQVLETTTRRQLGPFGPELSGVGALLRGDRPVVGVKADLDRALEAGVDWVVVSPGPASAEWRVVARQRGAIVFQEVAADDGAVGVFGVHVILRPARSMTVTEVTWARLAEQPGRCLGLATRRADVVDRCQRIRPVDVVRAGRVRWLANGAANELLFDCRWSGTAVIADVGAGSNMIAASVVLAQRRVSAVLAPPARAAGLLVRVGD